jgi:hypothetical protein
MVQDNIAQTTQRTLIKRETPAIESMLSVESASRGVCISRNISEPRPSQAATPKGHSRFASYA